MKCYSDNFNLPDMRGSATDLATAYVARQIRHFRLEAGLTQKDLACHLGCTYQQVQKYESGQNRVHSETLFRIARLLSISVESFFPGHAARSHPLLEQYFKLSDEKRALVAQLMLNLQEK